MRRLADTGAEWVSIAFAPDMPTCDTPDFLFADANPDMVTDAEVRWAVELAEHHGMRVIFKPMIDCADGTWRARIRFFRPVTEAEVARSLFGEFDPWDDRPQFRPGLVRNHEKWSRWWNNYTRYITHYAPPISAP